MSTKPTGTKSAHSRASAKANEVLLVTPPHSTALVDDVREIRGVPARAPPMETMTARGRPPDPDPRIAILTAF